MKLKERWQRFQSGPLGPEVDKVVKFPVAVGSGFRGKQWARIDNLRDEEARLERRLSDIGSNLMDREGRKEINVIVERLVKIKYEIGIRVKLLEG